MDVPWQSSTVPRTYRRADPYVQGSYASAKRLGTVFHSCVCVCVYVCVCHLARSAPQKALDFFAFDLFKRMMAGQSQQQGTGVETQGGPGAAFRTFMAAGLAG